MKILVTGANGFIGRALCADLSGQNLHLVPVVRYSSDVPNSIVLPSDDAVGWDQALNGCDVVVHLAGQALAKKNDVSSVLALQHNNVDLSLMLCRRAIRAGVQRFVFLSSAKVYGELTKSGESFKEDQSLAPCDPYAASKAEAEQKLMSLAKETGIELVIIRPPLVYGPGVKGNFASMIQWIQKGIPLPLAGLNNQRSMVAIDNLLSFIIFCSDRQRSPKAANQAFNVSDGLPVSTSGLLSQIASVYDTKARLFYIPVGLLEICLKLIAKSAIADRLLGSFVLDDQKSRDLLGWTPPVTMAEQLQRMRFVKNS